MVDNEGKSTAGHAYNYTILVKTGLKFRGWTNGNLYITIHERSEKLDRLIFSGDAVYPYDTQSYTSSSDVNMDEKPKIKIDRDGGWLSCWYIDWIKIENCTTGMTFIYRVQKWVKRNCPFSVYHTDTCLPQSDKYVKLRSEVLGDIRKIYQLEVKEPGLPPQVKTLPVDESFSFREKVILGLDLILNKDKIVEMLTSREGRWNTFDDVQNLYTGGFSIPKSSLYRGDDAYFGRQRLQGLNHSVLERCTEIPDNFNAENGFKNVLKEHINNEKLFIVNLEKLSDCNPLPNCTMTCPIAFFLFDNEREELMPIAIQLFQKEGVRHPVFYPTDRKNTWKLAKMWFNLADATYHQALTHLNFSHLMMEGVSVVSKRQFAPSHPIMKLLNPHFLYLMAIDSLALSQLTNPEGFINQTSNAGIEGHFDIMKKSMEWWTLNKHANLPENLKMRKVYEQDVLTNAYHFRDDALLLYDTIETYVKDYVGLYYESSKYVTEDFELQAWGKELILSRDEGGLGMKGVPNEGKFGSKDDLIQTLTPIIYTCSVGHAAANFQQYDEYADPFNYPYSLSGDPPTDNTTDYTDANIMQTIANKAQLLELMSITKILSEKTTNSLGNFEDNLIVDQQALEIVKQFRNKLLRDGETIDERNENRTYPYPWLHPTEIPNAISI